MLKYKKDKTGVEGEPVIKIRLAMEWRLPLEVMSRHFEGFDDYDDRHEVLTEIENLLTEDGSRSAYEGAMEYELCPFAEESLDDWKLELDIIDE